MVGVGDGVVHQESDRLRRDHAEQRREETGEDGQAELLLPTGEREPEELEELQLALGQRAVEHHRVRRQRRAPARDEALASAADGVVDLVPEASRAHERERAALLVSRPAQERSAISLPPSAAQRHAARADARGAGDRLERVGSAREVLRLPGRLDLDPRRRADDREGGEERRLAGFRGRLGPEHRGQLDHGVTLLLRLDAVALLEPRQLRQVLALDLPLQVVEDDAVERRERRLDLARVTQGRRRGRPDACRPGGLEPHLLAEREARPGPEHGFGRAQEARGSALDARPDHGLTIAAQRLAVLERDDALLRHAQGELGLGMAAEKARQEIDPLVDQRPPLGLAPGAPVPQLGEGDLAHDRLLDRDDQEAQAALVPHRHRADGLTLPEPDERPPGPGRHAVLDLGAVHRDRPGFHHPDRRFPVEHDRDVARQDGRRARGHAPSTAEPSSLRRRSA